MAERGGHDPQTLLFLSLSRRRRRLAASRSKVEEGGGVEPLTFQPARRFSRPIALHSAPPSDRRAACAVRQYRNRILDEDRIRARTKFMASPIAESPLKASKSPLPGGMRLRWVRARLCSKRHCGRNLLAGDPWELAHDPRFANVAHHPLNLHDRHPRASETVAPALGVRPARDAAHFSPSPTRSDGVRAGGSGSGIQWVG